MNILRAEHLGMCFGVRDAIALAHKLSSNQPLTVLGDLVHNETVLADLAARGVRVERDLASVKTTSVMITAHGASQAALTRVRERGHEVTEATCPLVHSAHRALRRLLDDGFHPVIIGRSDHIEVRGMTEDLSEFDVVLSAEEMDRLPERRRFGVVAQTTQPIERVRSLVQRLRTRFPRSEVRFTDTVCQPTKQRQSAAEELARQCEVVIVIGGAHSNNTRELVATCSRFCAQVHHVQTAADLREEWFDDAHVVGLTAGTSTPDAIIDAVEQRLLALDTREAAPAPHHFTTPTPLASMKTWLAYFEHNRAHRHPIPWHLDMNIEPRLRAPLIRSLQRFQVGESGEGRHLRQQVATFGSADYARAIDLFIKEEQEHARLMAEILKRLNAPLLERHWSDACFILLRRLFGLREELLVLLVPEMIAKRYFRALLDGTRDEVVRAVCAQILHDEEGHVDFHVAFLRQAMAKMPLWRRGLLRAAWRVVFRAACVVVMADHFSVLRACGVSPLAFWWDCGLIFDEAAAEIFATVPMRQEAAPHLSLAENR